MDTALDTRVDGHLSTVGTKRALLVTSHAMERAFHDVWTDDGPPGRRVLTMVRGAFAATLTARDIHQLSATEATLQASRLFLSWSTMRRHLALENTSTHLDRLAAAADHLLESVDAGYQHATALRVELESTKSMAERDQLTGLHNRHYLERYLGHGDKPADLLALLVDVDGLKQVNDGHGHEAGDALLRCVASTLRRSTRPEDVLIRWGGDEFLLLIPQLTAAAGLRYGERLASAIGAGTLDQPWAHIKPSASIGVSPARQTPLPMAQLDAALDHVKRHRKGHAALAPSQVVGPVDRGSP